MVNEEYEDESEDMDMEVRSDAKSKKKSILDNKIIFTERELASRNNTFKDFLNEIKNLSSANVTQFNFSKFDNVATITVNNLEAFNRQIDSQINTKYNEFMDELVILKKANIEESGSLYQVVKKAMEIIKLMRDNELWYLTTIDYVLELRKKSSMIIDEAKDSEVKLQLASKNESTIKMILDEMTKAREADRKAYMEDVRALREQVSKMTESYAAMVGKIGGITAEKKVGTAVTQPVARPNSAMQRDPQQFESLE